MTTHLDAVQDAGRQNSWKDLRNQLIFFIVTSCLFFAVTLFGASFLAATEPARTVIEIERLQLDPTTSDLSSLVRATPFSIDVERDAILSDNVINAATEKLSGIDSSTLKPAVLEGLEIGDGGDANRLEMSLSSVAAIPSDGVADIVNAIAAGYVDLRNRERGQQAEQVQSWANKKLASLRHTINVLKIAEMNRAAIDASSPADARLTDDETLLRFLFGATITAQDETLSMITTNGSNRSATVPLEDLENDYAMLQDDVKKLTQVSLQVEQPKEDLRNAENDLARFENDLDGLISSGILNANAATVLIKASPPESTPMLPWNLTVPAAAALSLVFALGVTTAKSRRSAAHTHQDTPAASHTLLSDPYWPMTPLQRQRDFPVQQFD